MAAYAEKMLCFMDTNGKVNYGKLAESEKFQQGINRLSKGLNDDWLIALMCAEENPFKCHRHLLIANELELNRNVPNVPVWHIRSDGSRIRAKKHLVPHFRKSVIKTRNWRIAIEIAKLSKPPRHLS